jgi:hypothetical protein
MKSTNPTIIASRNRKVFLFPILEDLENVIPKPNIIIPPIDRHNNQNRSIIFSKISR